MNKKALFSSAKNDWRTPRKLKEWIWREFNVDFDPCPYPRPEWDGLEVTWGKVNYVNPPYGPDITDWIKKALREKKLHGSCSIFLLPVRTDTHWFQELVLLYAKEIRFIKGRLKFEGAKWYAPFPSMLVIF